MSSHRAPPEQVTNLFLAGVGGQGLILVNRLLAQAAFLSGLDVKGSDTAGLAMRGGAVMGTLRIGAKVGTSIFLPGRGDVLAALEPLEGLHWIHMLRPGGTAVVSADPLWPAEVCLEVTPYPKEWRKIFEQSGFRVHSVPSRQLALQAGDIRMVNMVMTGAISHFLPMEPQAYQEAIQMIAPKGTQAQNQSAFELGRNRV